MITLIYDLVIDVDAKNYTLLLDKHKQDKKGNLIYETIGYYGTFESAIEGARRYCIKKQLGLNTKTLVEAIGVIKSITEEFSDLLKGSVENA